MTLSLSILAIFDVGGGELVLIGLVALLLFGGDLPKVMRQVGRVVGDLRRQAESLTSEFRDETPRSSYTPPRIKRPVDAPPTYPIDSTHAVDSPRGVSPLEPLDTSRTVDDGSTPDSSKSVDDSSPAATDADASLASKPLSETSLDAPNVAPTDSNENKPEPPPSP